MKQHITKDQLNKLSERGKKRLREWWKPQEGDKYISEEGLVGHIWWCEGDIGQDDMLLLSIGQMIEFVQDKELAIEIDNEHRIGFKVWVSNRWSSDSNDLYTRDYGAYDELCDALWEAVKEVLEKENNETV